MIVFVIHYLIYRPTNGLAQIHLRSQATVQSTVQGHARNEGGSRKAEWFSRKNSIVDIRPTKAKNFLIIFSFRSQIILPYYPWIINNIVNFSILLSNPAADSNNLFDITRLDFTNLIGKALPCLTNSLCIWRQGMLSEHAVATLHFYSTLQPKCKAQIARRCVDLRRWRL